MGVERLWEQVLTSHQAFLTEEALIGIATTTLENFDAFFAGTPLTNEVCYQCDSGKVVERCAKMKNGRCFCYELDLDIADSAGMTAGLQLVFDIIKTNLC